MKQSVPGGTTAIQGDKMDERSHPSCEGCGEPILIGEEVLFRDARQKPAVATVHGIRPSADEPEKLLMLVPTAGRYAPIPARDVVGHTRRSCLEAIQNRSRARGRAA